MSGCRGTLTVARPACRIARSIEKAPAHEAMLNATRKALSGNLSAARALDALVTSKGYQKLLPDRQLQVLKGARALGSGAKAFGAWSRIVNTDHFRRLNAKQVQVVSKTLITNRHNLAKFEKAYNRVLNDRPFEYARPDTRTRVLTKPLYYADRTMTKQQPDPRHHLPTKTGLNRWAANQKATRPARRVGNWSVRDEAIKNTRTRWAEFMNNWYERAPGTNKTYGEVYGKLVGRDWQQKLDHWARKDRKFRSCVPDLPPAVREDICKLPFM